MQLIPTDVEALHLPSIEDNKVPVHNVVFHQSCLKYVLRYVVRFKIHEKDILFTKQFEIFGEY